MRPTVRLALVMSVVTLVLPRADAQPAPGAATGNRPVVFVHGMGASAADMGVSQAGGSAPFGDLLTRIARDHPRPGVCQKDAQSGRPWDGSPCVFRYVGDAAGAHAPHAGPGPFDSQTAVQPNADKLAREVAEVARNADDRVILLGYSMGGAIIRTYLATHRADADRDVAAVILVDAVASGSWGYAFAGALPRRAGGELGARITELMRSLAVTAAAVDFNRPAARDLAPRSALFVRIAPMPLPREVNYYTFWGDIRVVIKRQLFTYNLPDFSLPSFGDLGLLPGTADPRVLPELGGQRFSPQDLAPGREALDIPHRARLELTGQVIRELIDACGRKPTTPAATNCKALVARHFDIPDVHQAIPLTLSRVMVDEPRLGGRVSLLDAILRAIGANS